MRWSSRSAAPPVSRAVGEVAYAQTNRREHQQTDAETDRDRCRDKRSTDTRICAPVDTLTQ
eukprot:7717715-Alexandrium_andersonii.AAC.1